MNVHDVGNRILYRTQSSGAGQDIMGGVVMNGWSIPITVWCPRFGYRNVVITPGSEMGRYSQITVSQITEA